MNSQRFEISAGTEDKGARLDRFLADRIKELSRTRLKALILEGAVEVSGRTVRDPEYRVNADDEIAVAIPEAEPAKPAGEKIPLDIVYEDKDVIVIDKPAGLVVHPAAGNRSGTLVNALIAHCGASLSGIGGEKRPGIVHRLDKETSGLIVIAKNEAALRHLQAQFKDRTVGKQYLALVDGQVQPPTAVIDAPIGRDPRQRKKMAVIPLGASAHSRPAQTQVTTITGYDDYTLLRCELFTGRTHQIRVHLAYIGFPIVGDKVYGRRKPTIPLGRHFLHASVLTVKRPSDDEELTLHAELPAELEAILVQLAEQ